MADYTKLDAAILTLIACRPVTFTSILLARSVQAHVKPLTEANPQKCGMRFVDGRLQALRKRGLIRYSGKSGWRQVAPKDADKPETAP